MDLYYRSLKPHTLDRARGVSSVKAAQWRNGDGFGFRYLVEGVEDLVLPDEAAPVRTDGLWRTTCFEAFVGLEGEAYLEFNFSPSGAWAAYRFDKVRDAMREAAAEVEVWLEGGETWIAVEAMVRCDALVAGAALGLSAVIEEQGGKSHWALDHPAGAADFHDRACFTAVLADIAQP